MKTISRRYLPERCHGTGGMALVLTLGALLIITVVVVTYSTVVRMEISAARSSFELEKANLLAATAVDEAMVKLKDNIPTDGLWAAAPGRLFSYRPDGSKKYTDLHSGTATGSTTGSVALNRHLADYPILAPNAEYANPDPMKVAWINVLKDGTRSTDAGYSPSLSNPIVGRYAYWADSETSKVNINTAGKAQSTYVMTAFDPPPADSNIQNLTGHPSRVDLSQLDSITGSESLATYNFAATSLWYGGDGRDNDFFGPFSAGQPWPTTLDYRMQGQGMRQFNSIGEWAQIDGITPEIIEKNKFYITAKASAPELNPWGLNKNWWQSSGGPQLVPNAGQPGWAENLRGNRLNYPDAKPFPTNSVSNYVNGTTEFPGPTKTGGFADSRYFVYPPVVEKYIANRTDNCNWQHMGWMMGGTYPKNLAMQNWINNVMALMERKDWPGMPSNSFVDKYGREHGCPVN